MMGKPDSTAAAANLTPQVVLRIEVLLGPDRQGQIVHILQQDGGHGHLGDGSDEARMNTTARMGTDRGSRIRRNACHGVAPSMAAASSRERVDGLRSSP